MSTTDLKKELLSADSTERVDFATQPSAYKHWNLSLQGRVAMLALEVDEQACLMPGYELKLNSYDLGVDIELYDAVQRLRFEHPEVGAVVISSNHPRVFCAGANIQMLGQSSHSQKINFCKFTNETRNGIEDASAYSGQTYICAIKGTAAGGGYELALACDHIMLADDGSTTVSLPELPLLAVLPSTGGLTRLMDKRMVRRDHADFFCTTPEGVRGRRALDWRLVDELVSASRFDQIVMERAYEIAATSDRPVEAPGIELRPLSRRFNTDTLAYNHVTVVIDRDRRTAHVTIRAPRETSAQDPTGIQASGESFWPLALARELDDAILHLRLNEEEIGTWVIRCVGDAALVEDAEKALSDHAEHWLVREVLLYLKRTLKRLDVSSRSLITLIEPGSCFTGILLELALASDRTYMLDGTFTDSEYPPPTVRLTPLNFGPLPTLNGLSRLENRFLGRPQRLEALRNATGQSLKATQAEELGLVTFIPDDIDWEDEVRLAIEERASFSPDALTGMEANLRFAGLETLESKIFGRLSAWQNWIFQRPNASGDQGALKLYGTGKKTVFDKKRA